MPTLFDPLAIGPLDAPNRVFMAPLTRSRAREDGTATALQQEHYAQRASAGLIIAEATAISPQGVGFYRAPRIDTAAHVGSWRPVTDAVHAAGGRIVLQLWHMGRASHPDFHGGALPVGPSAIAAKGRAVTAEGAKPLVTPRALGTDELPGIVDDYARAATNAMEAGFDGVEIHGANGYLIDQFLRASANQRTDAYGGSVEARWRFPLEVVDAVVDAVGAERTGIRLSPTHRFNSMSEPDPEQAFVYGAQELDRRGLAFLHLIDPLPGHRMHDPDAPSLLDPIRRAFKRPLIVNGGFDRQAAMDAVASGRADAVAFGTLFIANPDLPERLSQNLALNAPDPATFYTHDADGYTDYPAAT